MVKVTSDNWEKTLKRYLVKYPEHDREHENEYCTHPNIVVTITKKCPRRNRYHTFGGPVWSAVVRFDSDLIRISFLSPLKRPILIERERIVGLNLAFSMEED